MISDIEMKLVSMAENYGHYFNDKDDISNSEDWLYISDIETYDLQLVKVNRKNGSQPFEPTDWHEKKCYDYFYGFEKPCPFCTMKNVRRDCHYAWTYDNDSLNAELFLKDILIDWKGRPAKLQTATIIKDQSRKNEVINEYILGRNVLTGILSSLMDENAGLDAYKEICCDIGGFFDADRVLITDYSIGTFNTCWSVDDKPFVQVKTELTPEGKEALKNATDNMRYIWIPDVPGADKLDPSLKSYWTAAAIESMLIIPMHHNGEFVGTVSLHNPRQHMSETDMLTLVAMALVKNIYSHILEISSEKNLYADPLTGALNMSGLKKAAYKLFAENPDTHFSVSVCDIRYFGAINRRFSFELGDRILRKTAECIKNIIASDEVFCRISADQFCIIRKFKSEENTERDFSLFVDNMQCFPELTAANVKIDFQVGVYVSPFTGSNIMISSAIDKANIARNTLKDFHGSKTAFFSSDMLETSKREIELIQDFKSALENNEITVYYQPQCRYSKNIISGAEALVRWKSSKHGSVSPAEFIPLLERHGLIFELDHFVWELVCKNQQKWLEMGYRCPISVNVSRYDVLRNDICEDLCGLLEKYSIPKELLPLEITETAYIKNSEELIGVVDKLKGAGFIVEMDDFGSGYSSLNALKDVAVDLLKLDMKFLDDINRESRGRGGSILNGIVRMTRWLNLPVLAEGVETKEQAEYLKNIGCDLMQGYYFAKPMPADDFEDLLKKSNTGGAVDNDTEMMSAGAFMEAIVTNPILFNHMGAAAIVEHHNGESEILLFNDSFLEMIDCTREEYEPFMNQMSQYYAFTQYQENAPVVFYNVINDSGTLDFDIRRKDGTKRRIRLHSNRLLSDGDRHILLVTMDDISDLAAQNK